MKALGMTVLRYAMDDEPRFVNDAKTYNDMMDLASELSVATGPVDWKRTNALTLYLEQLYGDSDSFDFDDRVQDLLDFETCPELINETE